MTTIDLNWATATEIADAVNAQAITASEVTEAALAAITKHNPKVNAFTAVTADRARARAMSIDERRAAGRPVGPLAGVPFAVKNLIDIAGLPTLAGSRINRDRQPAAEDATLVTRMEDAGAVLVGALNMGEYAYDFTGENSHDGPSRNPHDLARMSGGSSGGSGSAVAAGLVPIALGSDTNGSIRVPSSFCGLFGLKPTFGRLSRSGSFPFVSSLDHLGPLARNTKDLAASYDAMQGPDSHDPACTDRPPEPVADIITRGIDGLRIAVADGYFRQGASPEAVTAVETVAVAVGAVSNIELPEAARARSAAYVTTTAEGAALHLDRLRSRPHDFDPDVRDRLIAGALLPSAYVLQAQKFRRWYRDAVLRLFDDVDAILAPSTPMTAPFLGTKTFLLDGREVALRPNIGIYTQPISFIGFPVVAVPAVANGGLPIGVQIIAAPWREDVALRIAWDLESQGVARAPRPAWLQ